MCAFFACNIFCLSWQRPLTVARPDDYASRLAHREAALKALPSDGHLVAGLRRDLPDFSQQWNTTPFQLAPTIWYFFQPLWSCPDKEYTAGTWVCGTRRMHKPCIIYSVTHRDDGHALANSLESSTKCKVYRFDMEKSGSYRTSLGKTDGHVTIHEPQRVESNLRNYELPPLTFKHKSTTIRISGLPELMARMGHRRLDLLYLDIWGLERGVAERFASESAHPYVNQICMQVYYEGRVLLENLFKNLQAAGYRDFASTLHRSNVQQYSFVHHSADLGRRLGKRHQLAIHQAALAAPSYSVGDTTWSCESDDYVGWIGDGTKWICDGWKLRRGCVVYSFGGSTNGQFDIAMSDSGCEVHTFDLVCAKKCVYGPCFPEPIQCHRLGLWTSDEAEHSFGDLRAPVKSLRSIMNSLGHSFVDVLKVDIEKAEYPVFKALHKSNFEWQCKVGQILIEIHRTNQVSKIISPLLHAGFAVFHREENIYNPSMAEFGLMSNATGQVTSCQSSESARHALDFAASSSGRATALGSMTADDFRVHTHYATGSWPPPVNYFVSEGKHLCKLKQQLSTDVTQTKSGRRKLIAPLQCIYQPWLHGCRPTAEAMGLLAVSAFYSSMFENAIARPHSARYLVVTSPGGGFGNQWNTMISYLAAAILTERLLVLDHVDESSPEEKARLRFNVHNYFHSTTFPFHGLQPIHHAIACAQGGEGMTYTHLPCAECEKKAVTEQALLTELIGTTQVVRTFDYGSYYNRQSELSLHRLLSAAKMLNASLPFPALKRLHLSAVQFNRALWRLTLQPTPYLMKALSHIQMPMRSLGAHVRTGDSSMVTEQLADARNQDAKGFAEVQKCGILAHTQTRRLAILRCIKQRASSTNQTIVFMTDHSALAADAVVTFGKGMMSPPPGKPRHTYRPLHALRNGSVGRFTEDPHLKQMLDFIVLGSTSSMLLTCGSFGRGAMYWNAQSDRPKYVTTLDLSKC